MRTSTDTPFAQMIYCQKSENENVLRLKNFVFLRETELICILSSWQLPHIMNLLRPVALSIHTGRLMVVSKFRSNDRCII